MTIEPLLAKSYVQNSGDVPTFARLVPHLRAVERAGESITEIAGDLILGHVGLPIDPWLPRLRRTVKTACLCHDIGKANEGFQRMVRGELNPKQQPVRHELLSVLILLNNNQPVRKWALDLLHEPNDDADTEMLLNCVIGAVAGHHLKIDTDWEKAALALQGGCGTSVRILLDHPDLSTLFRNEPCQPEVISLVDGDLARRRFLFCMHSQRWHDWLERHRDWWRFAAVVKALVVAADVAGSAILPADGQVNIREWVNGTLSHRVSTEQIREVVSIRLNRKPPRLFQTVIGESKKRVTLVVAGCGSGKTAAAYLWAANHANGKKLFFCYPTTGTATEGFLGYVHETDIESSLLHSRAIVDLEGVAEVFDDEEGDHLLRIESLNAWSPQVVVCTADTVLALVRNNRRGLYNSPAILSGAFVFDELHAYDNRMFEAVVAFIKAMPGASFLLMTASLPSSRRDFLYSNLPEVHQVPSAAELETIPRYEFQWLKSDEEAFTIAKIAAAENKRVLWIANTVSRAQKVFNKLKEEKDIAVRTYHSRFKYQDRVRQHRKIIQWFGNERRRIGIVAVTTQVAEMSLDLDADLLISDVAPVHALIQRLGRLNRRVTVEKPGRPRTAYFRTPENSSPYECAQLDLANNWINELIEMHSPLSQSDLTEVLNRRSPTEDLRLDTRVRWLDSGWLALPEQVRDLGYSVSVIMQEDLDICKRSSREIIRRAIPMNFDRRMKNWAEFKGNLVAPNGTVSYGAKVGAILL